MEFSWSPGWTLLIAVFGLVCAVFAGWAVHTYFRSKSPDSNKKELPSVSYHRSDPMLKRSLYSYSKFDITNPRDSTNSLVLNDNRYSAPPPAYSRAPSFVSSTIHPRESRSNLSYLRQSIYGDDDSLFETPRLNMATSLVPSRTSSPAASRRQSMASFDCRENGPSLATLRHSIYGDSNPVFTSARNSWSSLPLPPPRPKSLSPTRMTPRQSASDLSRGRQPSGNILDLRNSLFSDESPVVAYPENLGITPFVPRARNASPSQAVMANNRFSCPDFTLSDYQIPAPQADAIISIPHVRARPKTSNERRPTTSVLQDSEYIPRSKTSSTESSNLVLLEVEPISRPKTSSSKSAPSTTLEEPIARPKTSSARQSPAYVEDSNWALQPQTFIEYGSSVPRILEPEYNVPPAPVYARVPSSRRVSRHVGDTVDSDTYSIRRGLTLRSAREASTDPFVDWATNLQPESVKRALSFGSLRDHSIDLLDESAMTLQPESIKTASPSLVLRAPSIGSIRSIGKADFGTLANYFRTGNFGSRDVEES